MHTSQPIRMPSRVCRHSSFFTRIDRSILQLLSLGYDVKAASVALLLLSSLMLLCYLFLFLFHYYFFSVPGEKLRSTSSELFASFAMKVYRD